MRIVGLMSGTSADSIDAALVEWPDDAAARPFRLLAQCEAPLGAQLQDRIHRLAAGRLPAGETLRELCALDVLLADRFARAARSAVAAARLRVDEIAAVASHGQTVAHHPELGATLQIGDPSRIAERTGLPTVADFRARDLAVGGEGAPLAPFFHWAALTDSAEDRIVLNLGGIANLTWLPAGAPADRVIAFDVGPANALIDSTVQLATRGRERMDRDGHRARRGTVDRELLAALLDDAFLERRPPKSTGRERYGWAQSEALLQRCREEGRDLDDAIATLVAFSAEAVARAVRDFLPARPARLLVGGGGVRNPVLLRALRARFGGATVEPMDAAGVPARAAEAMAFSLLGRNALLGIPNHLPQCTGARCATVLGELAPAAPSPSPSAQPAAAGPSRD